jgi:glycosyltransferase involved in cell wall biosynthesis
MRGIVTAPEEPLVSIVTPAYNQAAFLRDTIESVLRQDYPRVEYIVLDDGSTDDTPRILAEYTGRLTWERHPNMGQTATINRGWQMARGEVVTWLNSDDTLLPGALTTAVNYLREHPDVGIVFGDTLFTEEDGTPIERTKNRDTFDYETFVLGWSNPIAQPSAFIRRTVIEDVGLLDPYYYYFMDWDFWLRAELRHRIVYINELLSTYRLHAESKTVAQAVRAAPELVRMYEKFFSLDGVPGELRRRKARARASMYLATAAYFHNGGDQRRASHAALSALRTYPVMPLRPRMLHRFLYALFGGTRVYGAGRSMARRARGFFGRDQRLA